MKEIFDNVVYSPQLLEKITSLVGKEESLVFLLGKDIDDAINLAKSLLVESERFKANNMRVLMNIRGFKIENICDDHDSCEIYMDFSEVYKPGYPTDCLNQNEFVNYLAKDLSDFEVLDILYQRCLSRKNKLSSDEFKKLCKLLHISDDDVDIYKLFKNFHV